jgi:eukaryotic-like serine/threonine-protein kinase
MIGRGFAGYTVTAALESEAPASVYRALASDGRDVLLYIGDAAAPPGEALDGEVARLKELSAALPDVVPVLGGGLVDGAAWLATPAGDDTPIEEILHRFRPIVLELIAGIGRVLESAHALGLVHGDVGPHSVVITSEGETMLKMFGFHRIFGASAARSAAARYRAPERFDGRTIDERVDVYGLGMLLHSVLAGRPPFEGSGDLAASAAREMPAPPERLPARLAEVLARALAKDPDARFPTVSEFLHALRSLGVADLGLPVSLVPSIRPSSGPSTERSALVPQSRDTLPAGTLPPAAVRIPPIRVVELGLRRSVLRVAGTVAIAAVAGFAGSLVCSSNALPMGAPRLPAGAVASPPVAGAQVPVATCEVHSSSPGPLPSAPSPVIAVPPAFLDKRTATAPRAPSPPPPPPRRAASAVSPPPSPPASESPATGPAPSAMHGLCRGGWYGCGVF